MTIKQKQCLLAYLGYYNGAIDGIWGEQSLLATERFQNAYQLGSDGIFGPGTETKILEVIASGEKPKATTTGTFWDEMHYWTREEFRCQCGGKYCNGFPAEPSEKLVRLAENVRGHFGRPGHRSSGLRCKTWNTIQGGVSNSKHMTGEALDFRIEGKTSAQVLEYVNTLSGVNYAYAIDSQHVHMDVL